MINPLPVELVYWDAQLLDDRVALNWITETEINNDYFLVERSADGVEWEFVLQVEGAGNSTQTIEYLSYDENPFFGLSYYRLKQVDFDGATKYFEIKSVNQAIDANLFLYPNPTKNVLNIRGYVGNPESIKVVNAYGQVVNPKYNINSSDMSIDMSGFPNGLYLAEINGMCYKVIKE